MGVGTVSRAYACRDKFQKNLDPASYSGPRAAMAPVQTVNPVQSVAIGVICTGSTGLARCTGFDTEPLPYRFKR